MKTRIYPVALITGILTLLILGVMTAFDPLPLTLLPLWMIFCGLIVFSAVFSIPMGGGAVSLLPMLSVASYLVLGPVAAGWAAACAAVLYTVARHYWSPRLENAQRPDWLYTLNTVFANITLNVTSILGGGVVYIGLGGMLPLREAVLANLLPLSGLSLVYLAINYTLAGAIIISWKRASFQTYLGSLRRILLYEAVPLVFASLAALIYTRIGFLHFLLFTAILVGVSLIARNLYRASQRLERRVQELDSLYVVGQALSASLQLETIIATIYEQVARLMSAENFYVALYNPETNEVSFPLAVENGEFVHWRSRCAGEGLTEHILHTRVPLLICRDVAAHIKSLGIDQIGRSAKCWLGIPILAGTEPLGVITVQSYTESEVYDTSHQDLLFTIASQAAIAIQNARLYERTDEALTRRVQELNSILRTTREGILLLDPELRILAINRALAELVGATQTELSGQQLGADLLSNFGYSLETWEADCAVLIAGTLDQTQRTVMLGQEKRAMARTLSAVRDREGAIDGWLLNFRDITEELELARLREDMTDMLVHDLRSPLTVVMGSLTLLRRKKGAAFEQLLDMAQQNSERILSMVNELLDISKLENGQLPLRYESVNIVNVIEDVVERFTPLALEADISLETELAPQLPILHADMEILKRVLGNLVDNAIKFTPDGGHVRLWARNETLPEVRALVFGVSDDGPGIPDEIQTHLFEKFQQAETLEARRRGTGLGLAFCKLAVEAHGGHVWVKSAPGQGATFAIVLPLS